MAKAYLSIGTNVGEKVKNLTNALTCLQVNDHIKLTKVSTIYQTAPIGYTNQDIFLNIAVEIETTLTPEELLSYCLASENKLGRVRLFKWGPRLIDIDILLYEGETRQTEMLQIPHPYMSERAFVMIPLAEIAEPIAKKYLKPAKFKNQAIEKTNLKLEW